LLGLVGVACVEAFAASEIERRISGRADVITVICRIVGFGGNGAFKHFGLPRIPR